MVQNQELFQLIYYHPIICFVNSTRRNFYAIERVHDRSKPAGYRQKMGSLSPPQTASQCANVAGCLCDLQVAYKPGEAKALLMGTDVDQPRNLAKSVTVE